MVSFRRRLYALSALVVGILGLIASGDRPVFAQGFTASIMGSVQDMSGAALPAAAVTVKHVETGLTRTVQADSSGNYNIPSLPVGQYEVTAEKMGFRREVRRGIDLVVAQEARVNLILQVGGIEQEVTVTADAPLVNTTLSSTSGLVTESQIKDLPLNGRSFDQLLTLNTGTVNNSSNVNNGIWTAFSVAGKRPETNRFTINGIDYMGGNANGQYITPMGASGQLLGVEAVREYNVLQHTYGAEYGKRAGGQISIVTSSGTNQFHGDVFEYLRNSAFDARNFFDQVIGTPPFKRHQFGGAVGGPIKKDKLFFFANYEGFQQRLAVSNVAIVPDSQARLGFLPCNIITPTPNSCPASGYASVPGLQTGMLPFANYFWPAAGPELLIKGLPSGTAYSYSNPGQSIGEHFGLFRLDYNLSGHDTFSVNYTNDDGHRTVPQLDPIFAQSLSLRAQTVSLQETHVFSPSLVNVSTLGFTRSHGDNSTPSVVPIPANLVFLPGGNPGNIIIGGSGISAAGISSLTGASGANPAGLTRNHYTWADDVHFTKGRHSWSAGGWIQRVQENLFGANNASAGNISYSTLQAFLQDKPSQFLVNRNPIPVGYRSLEAAWYVQDEIKLVPNFTMRIGLRDELTNGWNEVAGRCANYFFDANLVIQTDPHIGSSCLAKNNATSLWQPRVGLAWDPTGTGAWAVRAGFGIYNDLLDNLANRIYTNPPYNAREQFSGVSLLSLIPLQKGVPPPPACSPTQGNPCSIYFPGGVDPNMFTPTVQEWSFTIERQLSRDLKVEVAYVGDQAYHTGLSMDANTARPEVCASPQGCRSGGVLAANQAVTVPQGTLYLPSKPPIVVNGLTLTQRPNPYVGNGVSWWDLGTSSYHSLNVSLLKRTSHGLTFKANYTYAKVMDLNSAVLSTSGTNEPPDLFAGFYNLDLNRGIAAYSVHHQFNANFSYQLPFGNGHGGIVNQLIGGWQWNGIVTAQGGFPFTPVVGSNTSGTGDTNQSDVPNWNPNFHGPVILGNTDHWYDSNAFSVPTAGTFGNVSRGSLRGPGLVDFDTSLFKKFKLNERLSLQFRAEAFNILNHPNFASPNIAVFSGSAPSPSAGVITAMNGIPRQLQFALKLLF
jgi:hypothetical protein